MESDVGSKSTDDELESKKAQEVIGLLLNKPDDSSDEVLQEDFTSDKIVQDSSNATMTVAVSDSPTLNICHVLDTGILLESSDISQSLACAASSIQLEDGILIQSFETVDESDSSDAVTKFIDGQAVQLEDGTTAYIHASPREGLQPVQLEDGTMAYLSQAGNDLFNGEASTLELDCLSTTQPIQVNDADSKEIDCKIKNVLIFEQAANKNTEKSFPCPYDGCNRLYTTLHHLKVHERSHTGDKPFKCSCGKSFATGYGLKSHNRVHTGETPYKCGVNDCKKAFKTSGDLQKHLRTHTGERPFKCTFNGCNRAFTTSNIRKVHMRTHTGERPYVCATCARAFASATNYKNHVRIHTGEKPYICAVSGCHKRFTEYSSLYKHQVVHTHSKPYVCNLCNNTYRQTSTLAMHRRTAHGIYEAVDPNDPEMPSIYPEAGSSKKKSKCPSKTVSSTSKGNATDEDKITVQNNSTNEESLPDSKVSSVTPTVVNLEAESPQDITEHSVFTVIQEGENLSSSGIQQIVLVTSPEQLAALQQLAQRGQLDTILGHSYHSVVRDQSITITEES